MPLPCSGRFLLLLFVGIFTIGCDDGTEADRVSSTSEVRQITQAVVGDACVDNSACDFCGGETCDSQTGLCVSGSPPNCSDGNPCTQDLCTAGACDHPNVSNGTSCEDGDACTDTGTCQGGNCNTSGKDCEDGNPCTDDSCNGVTGCQNIANSNPCSDGSVCTIGDICSAGSCQPGSAKQCDDGNPCTSDSCDPVNDCQYSNLAAGEPCSDGIPCTQGDACDGAGKCDPGTPNNGVCTQTECAVGVCVVGAGCQLDAALKKDQTCRASAGTCDLPEICDGNNSNCPTDAFRSSSFVCVPASCEAGIQTDQVLCSGGAATCGTAASIDCGGYACNSASPAICRTTCGSDNDCLGTHYCESGSCSPRTGVGENCLSDAECSQGDSCVDGLCCNSTCSGQCEACDVQGFEGQCLAVSGAPHPGASTSGPQRNACSSDGSSCAGTCDGNQRTSCVYPAGDTVCAAASCDGGLAVETSLCSGAGSCVTPAASNCSPYLCGDDRCLGECTLDSHCEGGLQCNGGTCVPPFDDGASCTLGSQCEGGNCVDGVCCESSCTGQCEACNLGGSEGRCVATSGAPVGMRPACPGEEECAGVCDGSNRRSCVLPGNAISCRNAACSNSQATLSASCDGAGQCSPEQSVSCKKGCEGTLCADGECATNKDCRSGEVCHATVCVPAAANGMVCSKDSDCSSAACVDGYCCNSACGAQCEACDVEGAEGTCVAVPDGQSPHGARQSCASDGSTCGGTCNGSDRDSCDYPRGIACRAAACSAGLATVSALCAGSGSCPRLEQQDCGADGCATGANVCEGACADDPDACTAGEFCSAGECVTQRNDGAACGKDEQCEGGHCVDGVCCNTACSGQCSACDVMGSVGTCKAIADTPRGGRLACEGSGICGATCDGQNGDSCAFPDDETSCGQATCEAGVVSAAPSCNGTGRCSLGTVTSCSVQLCEGTQCASGCTQDADCLGTLICSKGKCEENPLIDGVDRGSCGCRVPGAGGRLPDPFALLLVAPFLVSWARRRAHARATRSL